MNAMQISKATAKPAFELLQCLMSSSDPDKDDIASTEAMLAKMQAVHCCVRLLCPPAPATDPETLDISGHNRWSMTLILTNTQCIMLLHKFVAYD